MYDTVLFDLDGTLTDSAEGIIRCARAAIENAGYPDITPDVYRKFIGPPLKDSFMRFCGMSAEEAAAAVVYYRKIYTVNGWKENNLYPGIRALIKGLNKAGVRVLLATAKPLVQAERILDYFGLKQYFAACAGPVGDNDTSDKGELILRAMNGLDSRHAAMVGDRGSDISGAHRAGVDGIGVSYGFADDGELEKAGAEHICKTVEELSHLLLNTEPENKGYFISLEGLDGCGKTTQMDRIEAELQARGYVTRRTREPGGCRISEKIRDILLDIDNKEMTDVTEALLYAASRAQHVREVIQPALQRGEVVLCDRFVDSSIAFQGGGRALGAALITQINVPAINGCMPDTTVYLRLDAEASLLRRANATKLDRIESEKRSFHIRVEETFDQLSKEQAQRFLSVDATMLPDAVTEAILPELIKRLQRAEVT